MVGPDLVHGMGRAEEMGLERRIAPPHRGKQARQACVNQSCRVSFNAARGLCFPLYFAGHRARSSAG